LNSTGPYFFLSYAHTPRRHDDPKEDPDRWIKKLFNALTADILHLTNATPEMAGFIDRDMRLGERWPDQVAEALATCRVFVPLYSQRYFSSEYCGKEWAAFARRELDHAVGSGERVAAILPALWAQVDLDDIPSVARPIQVEDLASGSRYRSDGFFGIMKVSTYKPSYDRAVLALAKRIVEVGNKTRVSPTVPADYESLASAFGPYEVTGKARRRPIRITVAALDNSGQLPNGRTGAFYGVRAEDWNPYRPKSRMALAEYAAGLARCVGYEPTVGAFEEHIGDLIAEEEPTAPGLMLVDAWASMDPRRHQQLRDFDASHRPWIKLLLPWNQEDEETAAAEADLSSRLRECLGSQLGELPPHPRVAVSGIPTIEAFGHDATKKVLTAGGQYLKWAEADQPPGPRIERLKLTVPDPRGMGETE
jgi:FxsC-like protein